MHNAMPKTAAEAWMYLDMAMDKLKRTQEQLLQTEDKADLLFKVRSAAIQIQSAMDFLK